MAAENYNKAIQFRAPDWTRQQLDDLGEKWKMNRSQVVLQCITLTWSRLIDNEPQAEAPTEETKGSKKK